MNNLVDKYENFGDDFWNSLTKEQQLEAFCAISRRIYTGSVINHGSFRHVLYDVFEFGPEAYIPAQLSGFLSINNLIFDAVENDHL